MGAARRDFDPVGNFHFLVEVDGIIAGKFAAVDGLSFEVELIEYRVSDQPNLPRYRPGTAKYGRITLKRGYVENTTFNDWVAKVQQGDYKRLNLNITLCDNAQNPVCSWDLFRCLPAKWSIASLEGKGNDALYESLEIAVEEIRVA